MVHGLKNYMSLIGLSLFMVTCLIIFSHLWKIAAAKAGAAFLNPDHLLWYIAFNEWVLIAIPDIQLDMEHDLRSGRLSYLLPRPISYIGSVFAEGLGTLLLNLTVLGYRGLYFYLVSSGRASLLAIDLLHRHPAGDPGRSDSPDFSNPDWTFSILDSRCSPIQLGLGKTSFYFRGADPSLKHLPRMDADDSQLHSLPLHIGSKKRISP